ncbi:transcription-repair coupling factor [Actinomycetota bacterium]|nr:transcription-repair coupling factor [Actinomycetota bacterium]
MRDTQQLAGLLELVRSDPAFVSIFEQAQVASELDLVGPSVIYPLAIAQIRQSQRSGAVLILTTTGRAADELAADLSAYLPDEGIEVFPSWETLPHERLSPSADTVGRRMAVLRRLAHPIIGSVHSAPITVLITSVRAALQPIVADLGDQKPVELKIGDQASLTETVSRLVALGYERVDLVDRRGQIAVRGGILDVFPPTQEHPIRVEFWGDDVEELRYFAVADQRSLEDAEHGLWAPPVRELLLTEEVKEKARLLGAAHVEVAAMCEYIANGQSVEGMESLSSVLAGKMSPLHQLLPPDSSLILVEPERINSRALDVVKTAEEFLTAGWHSAAVGGASPIDLSGSMFTTMSEVVQEVRQGNGSVWNLTQLPRERDDTVIMLNASENKNYHGDAELAGKDIAHALAAGSTVVVTAEGHGSIDRIAEEFDGQGISAVKSESVAIPAIPKVAQLITAHVDRGFHLANSQLWVFSESDLMGTRSVPKDLRKMPSRRRGAVDPLTLNAGDYIVHEHHGVGRYVEMITRTIGGAEREYLIIEYAPSKRGQPADRLFVPMDQLDLITRYVGGEAPSVHRLGGADWQKAKGRARKAVKQIAGELIRLYAARQASKGYSFGADTPWQGELEDAFPYVETPDQLSTIDEVKRDMERQIPMDRLVCGDVGFGKTEIAIRAAFKAVQDGKQVAVLVPTTLLVQQHFTTFSERYSAFPVKVAALSRFTPNSQVKETVEGLAQGSVDIVIGTHRLLTRSVKFKDLGLVIVDEEQRFGVEHKEHLKALRTNVDVLAMSATPIPRTLEMAVTGIREMSVIQTPPEERHPVLTFVGPYDEKQIAAAIHRELLRDGQTFFIHNRVESIDRVAARIRTLVPEARIAVAHGQMDEGSLEQVIVRFWDKEVDVLVCTTIVESGIDIPNANTLIVDRADKFGLSQMHQLRGRVGRGRERAYSYFLYDPNKPLTETAHERLATIAQRTDLGSGMQIALKDLEIRGAGNMLGGEQSGHIADVGFDLYLRLVGEALSEYKNEPAKEVNEVRVELPINASIPTGYVPQERLRLEAYKRLADASSGQSVDEVVAELIDRYGAMPGELEALIGVARFRVAAKSAGVQEVIATGKAIRLSPVVLPESRAMRVARVYPGTTIKEATSILLVPKPTSGTGIGAPELRDTQLLEWLHELFTVLFSTP